MLYGWAHSDDRRQSDPGLLLLPHRPHLAKHSSLRQGQVRKRGEGYQNSRRSLWQRKEDKDSVPKHPREAPNTPEVGQAQLQLLPGFVSGDVVGGRASFILGEKKKQ